MQKLFFCYFIIFMMFLLFLPIDIFFVCVVVCFAVCR